MSTGTPCGDPPFDPPYRNLITGKIEFGPMPTPQPLEPSRVAAAEIAGVEKASKDRDLRDWFAGMALQTLMFKVPSPSNDGAASAAKAAYDIADAMMAERAKRSA
jgi:hypothetical protein